MPRRDALTATSFFCDVTASVLKLDAYPTGLEIKASTLQRSVSIRAKGSVMCAWVIRRDSPFVPGVGAVTVERSGVPLMNVAISGRFNGPPLAGGVKLTRSCSLVTNGSGLSDNNATRL